MPLVQVKLYKPYGAEMEINTMHVVSMTPVDEMVFDTSVKVPFWKLQSYEVKRVAYKVLLATKQRVEGVFTDSYQHHVAYVTLESAEALRSASRSEF